MDAGWVGAIGVVGVVLGAAVGGGFGVWQASIDRTSSERLLMHELTQRRREAAYVDALETAFRLRRVVANRRPGRKWARPADIDWIERDGRFDLVEATCRAYGSSAAVETWDRVHDAVSALVRALEGDGDDVDSALAALDAPIGAFVAVIRSELGSEN